MTNTNTNKRIVIVIAICIAIVLITAISTALEIRIIFLPFCVILDIAVLDIVHHLYIYVFIIYLLYTIFWTLDMRKGKTKTTDGRKDRRDKMQRKAKKDLDK